MNNCFICLTTEKQTCNLRAILSGSNCNDLFSDSQKLILETKLLNLSLNLHQVSYNAENISYNLMRKNNNKKTRTPKHGFTS